MIIGIDIDDTISDTYEVLFNYAQEYTVKVLKKEPIIKELNSCTTHFYTRELHGWNDEEETNFFKLYYKKVMENIKLKTLALEYLKKLSEENHKIILITSRWNPDDFDIAEVTKKWLEEDCIPYDKLIVNASDKTIAAKQENLDVFIDDSFKNCKAVSDIGIKTYMMDSRVNRGLNDEKITRVYSWPHLYMELENK